MPEKKHIMFYISTLRRGGAERVIVNLAEGFLREGYKVSIVTPYRKPPELEYVISSEITRIISEPAEDKLQGNRLQNFKTRVHTLSDIWKENKPALIVSFVGKNNMMALLSTWKLHIPVVISVRGNPASEYASKSMNLAAKLLFPHAAGIVLQTNQAKAYFSKPIQKKAVILPNPLNPLFIKERFEGERKNEIVTVTTMDENKNQKMLVSAFARIAGKFPDVYVTIYGEGPKRAELEQLADSLGIREQIKMPGESSNIPEDIYRSRIFVMTSNTEGSPNALIEAMSLGLACVSTDCPCGGPAELIEDGVNGMLVPVNDDEKLAEKLEQILTHPQLEQQLGIKATQIQEKMEPETVFTEWKKYLENLEN
ncbi:MAG: glycosyltransferase [Lachnospiraceae bacterium]|nr:glycosyltransferase [Lachnospiraceae bacterium]